MLSDRNSHERDQYITFDEGPHIYTVHGDSTFTSVTTFNAQHFPKFDADKIIDNMMRSKNWPSSKYFGMTKEEIKMKWSNNGKESSTMGTDLHYYIECFYNDDIPDKLKPRIEKDDPEALQYFHDFANALAKTQYKPYRTEWMIYHEELKLAGSVDMVFDVGDGTYAIYDWKRSKEIKKTNSFNKFAITECISDFPDANYWKYVLQLNIYKKIIEEKYGLKISELCLVIFHPNNKNYIKINIPDHAEKINDLFKWRHDQLYK